MHYTRKFEYVTLAVKIKGARSGVISAFLRKHIADESQAELEKMGAQGWELVSVIPLVVGAIGGDWTDSAICFFKRSRDLVAGSQLPSDANIGRLSETLDANAFNNLVFREQLKERASDEKYLLTEDDWKFISETRSPEAIPLVSRALKQNAGGPEYRARALAFFSNLFAEESTPPLYSLCEQVSTFDVAFSIMTTLGIFHLESIIKLLQSTDRTIRLNAINLAFVIRGRLSKDDVQSFAELIKVITESFPSPVYYEKKGILTKSKQVWKCVACLQEVEVDSNFCPCGTDQYGVTKDFGGRETILKRLERRKLVLEAYEFQSS